MRVLTWLWVTPLWASAALALPAVLSMATGQRLFGRFPVPAAWRRAMVRRRGWTAGLAVVWGAGPWAVAAASQGDVRLSVGWAVWGALVAACFGRLFYLAVGSWHARVFALAPAVTVPFDVGFFPDLKPALLPRPRALPPLRTKSLIRGARVWLAGGVVPLHLLLRMLPPGRHDHRGLVMLAYLGLVAVVWLASWTVFASDRFAARRASLPTTNAYAAETLGLSMDTSATRLRERWPSSPFLPAAMPGVETLFAMSGSIGSRRVWLVEERARVRSRSATTHTVRHWVVLCALPGVQLPSMTVGRRTAFGASQMTVAGLSVESEDFNRQFHVVHNDQRYAHAVLHPRMVEHVVATMPQGSQLTIQGDAAWLWSPGPLTPWNVPAAVACLTGLADLFPRHVAVDHRSAPRPATSGAIGSQ